MVWAAGVQGRRGSSPACPGEHDRAGRAEVAADLSSRAIPTSSSSATPPRCSAPDGHAVPGIAPAAKQMGAYVGGLIAGASPARPPPAPFRYRHAGDLATIGRGSAVVRIGPLQLTGLAGWLFWGFVHIYFLIGLRARFFVALDWLWSYVTYHRGARLITGEEEG